jgi:hypothetical protein
MPSSRHLFGYNINNCQHVKKQQQKNLVRKSSAKYMQERYRAKNKKYQQKEGKEYTYKKKEKEEKQGPKKEKLDIQKKKPLTKSAICYGCGKVYANK